MGRLTDYEHPEPFPFGDCAPPPLAGARQPKARAKRVPHLHHCIRWQEGGAAWRRLVPAASARWAATAMMPLQRRTQAAWAAGLRMTGTRERSWRPQVPSGPPLRCHELPSGTGVPCRTPGMFVGVCALWHSPLFALLLLSSPSTLRSFRSRFPLPPAPARCRCGRPLGALGDHVAACPRSGVFTGWTA